MTLSALSDTVRTNNTAGAALIVKPQPQVLVLVDRFADGAVLANALTTQQMRVDVLDSSTIPSRPEDLAIYDSIILNNVAATSLKLDQHPELSQGEVIVFQVCRETPLHRMRDAVHMQPGPDTEFELMLHDLTPCT